ncbi:putative RNA-directed DNA polymerase, eukaryota, reverse transcriptase zinc-binding domain protein [Tanacetum coccineum]
MINTSYSINLNTPYGSAEGQYAILIIQNTPYCLEERIRCLDFRDQYDVLSGKVDTSYPTGGYDVSVDLLNLIQECNELDRITGLDLAQKAHAQWDVEDKFQDHASNVISTNVPQFVCLTDNDRIHLDKDAALEEIKNAPISLIGLQYKILAKLLANRLVGVIDELVSHEQSTFISGLQILDGPLMLSEVIDWYKKKNKKLLIFKVDFEKAYDSVSWTTSVLVNGSPTKEFSIKFSLRQGDPLSPFLFILVMEGLHVAMKEALQSRLIKGVSVGNSNFKLSHLFYADDVVMVLDWSTNDMHNIIRVLNVFYLASGLKNNINKSNVYSVRVFTKEVESIASFMGCSSGSLAFNYLGLPIGTNMNNVSRCNTLVDQFRAKLSSWKANLLSIGSHLTLLKTVLGSVGIYYMSIFKVPATINKLLESLRASFFWGGDNVQRKMVWIKWDSVLASNAHRGLGVGSLKSFNLALLQK